MARWTVDQQIEKIDEKIKELQAKRKELLSAKRKQATAAKKTVMKSSELKHLKKLKQALDAKGVSPDKYGDVIGSI